MPIKYRILPKLSPQDIKRFWSKVNIAGPNDCWHWQPLRRMTSGYGKFTKRKIEYGSHRIAYLIQHQQDPLSHLVCHRCDNKLCVNGRHLFLGTHQVNADDMIDKGRSCTGPKNGMNTHPEKRSNGEKNGHAKLTDAQVREICRAYDAGEVDQYELARRFQVWQMTISRIVRRVSRKTAHVSPE